ncbi:MAG: transporter substrate-binding domain-containing protein [Proteobacteria bacterium]|nr:transporter substrate-binding domain-containing protein [Pseudomonadota bacterium]MBI3498316.1 transporter substrate-binding domain-containing protein [Pseudomonadota bacterium]
MKVMVMLGAALGLAAAASMSGPANAQTKNLWNKISESGTLTCGAMAAVPMNSWKVDGPVRYEGYSIGFCRELVKELTKAMGKPIKLDFYETTFANVVLDLQSGKIDLWAGMSATEERKKALDMTGPLYDLAHCVVQRKGMGALKTWEDYSKPEIKISSATGTSDEKALQEMAPKAANMSFKDNAAAILAVQSGRADGYVTNVLSCLRILKESPTVFGEIVVPTPVRSLPSAGGVRKDGDGRFFKFVDEWAARSRADGTVKAVMTEAIIKNGLDPTQLPAGFSF